MAPRGGCPSLPLDQALLVTAGVVWLGGVGYPPSPIPFPLLCGNIAPACANMVHFQGHPTTRGYINSCPVREVCVYLAVVHSDPVCVFSHTGSVSFIVWLGNVPLCVSFLISSSFYYICSVPLTKMVSFRVLLFFHGSLFCPGDFFLVLFFTLCYGAFL